jgi:RecB family exonuclease
VKFNASMLKNWSQCALQGHLRMITPGRSPQHASATFGTCMHNALELYNETGDIDTAINLFELLWEHPELIDVEPEIWPQRTTWPGLRKTGIEALRNYADNNLWNETVVVAQEHKFCVPIGEHLISGVVDLLRFGLDPKGRPTLDVVDYKTNSRKPTKLELLLDVQFTTYLYASTQPEFWLGYEPEIEKYAPMEDGEKLYNKYMGVQRRASWYHLRTGQEIDAGPRDEVDYGRLYRLCCEVAKAEELEVYVPTLNGENCTFCPFKSECAVVAPLRDRLDLEIDDL